MIPEPRIRLREGIIEGKLGVVRRILKRWPELLENIDSRNGWSSLHYAASGGRYLICRHLIQLGHDSTAMLKTYDGDTCIHLAITKGDEQTVHLLLQHFLEEGLNLRSSGARRWAPIHIACRSNHFRCLALLLQCGADVMLEDEEGNTGLHVAMEYGASHCLPVLLESGGEKLAAVENHMRIKAREVAKSDETLKKFDQFAAAATKTGGTNTGGNGAVVFKGFSDITDTDTDTNTNTGTNTSNNTAAPAADLANGEIAARKPFANRHSVPNTPELRDTHNIKDLNDFLSSPGSTAGSSIAAFETPVITASSQFGPGGGDPESPRVPESPSVPPTSRLLNVAITRVRRGEDGAEAE
ncbi:unnamed protein product [Kluyveromyces dobzhanskii CBS 2104]|uniref:WGS project CCBQ000000000 data, contig 00058 n=1 Tax=Kluyveromyces dobzhanskii CBS 2104 TaxID=1427455 RepID=A0A0A8LDM5_9SACH|nr:unnamed protein product [Kluyveromyces dobzhanskii CBS 2104]